jgi:hypothetical protein
MNCKEQIQQAEYQNHPLTLYELGVRKRKLHDHARPHSTNCLHRLQQGGTASPYKWEALPHLTTGKHCLTLQLGSTTSPYNGEALPRFTTGKRCLILQKGSTSSPYNREALPHFTTGKHCLTSLTELIRVPWFRSALKAERIAAWSMISVFRNMKRSGDPMCMTALMQWTNKWNTKITGRWKAVTRCEREGQLCNKAKYIHIKQ